MLKTSSIPSTNISIGMMSSGLCSQAFRRALKSGGVCIKGKSLFGDASSSSAISGWSSGSTAAVVNCGAIVDWRSCSVGAFEDLASAAAGSEVVELPERTLVVAW